MCGFKGSLLKNLVFCTLNGNCGNLIELLFCLSMSINPKVILCKVKEIAIIVYHRPRYPANRAGIVSVKEQQILLKAQYVIL